MRYALAKRKHVESTWAGPFSHWQPTAEMAVCQGDPRHAFTPEENVLLLVKDGKPVSATCLAVVGSRGLPCGAPIGSSSREWVEDNYELTEIA